MRFPFKIFVRSMRAVLSIVSMTAFNSFGAFGTADESFTPLSWTMQFGDTSVAPQPDGRILVGSGFTELNGVPRTGLARLESDGTLDHSFAPRLEPASVNYVSVLHDGRIFIGGGFYKVGGLPYTNVAVLTPDGNLDPTFKPIRFEPPASGGAVSFALEPSGQIYLGGFFEKVVDAAGAIESRGVARLHPDGTIDRAFKANLAPPIYCLALEADGRVIVGGFGLIRLNSDGSQDGSFQSFGSDVTVQGIYLEPGGKIVIGGSFTNLHGTPRTDIARLNPDGTVDATFDTKTVGFPRSMIPQVDGSVLLGRQRVSGNGRLQRFDTNGVADAISSFEIAGNFSAAVSQNDGIIISASYTWSPSQQIMEVTLNRFLNNPGSESIEIENGNTIRWVRTGALPEVHDAYFELSTNRGDSWITLGPASKTLAGWEKSELSLPTEGLIRGRARADYGNASSGFIEFIGAFPKNFPPVLLNPIPNMIVSEGSPETVLDLRAFFSDHETGSEDLFYSVQTDASPLLFTATVDNLADTLTLNYAQFAGSARVIVRAMDVTGLSVQTSFQVTVSEIGDGDAGEWDSNFGAPEINRPPVLLVQSDGKIMAGLNTRLNSNGSADKTFDPEVTGGSVDCAAEQDDGGILIGGDFTSVQGEARNGIARLHPDGSLDSSFLPSLQETPNCFAIQPDGRILMGGRRFIGSNNVVRWLVARLLPNGELDESFSIPGYDPDFSCKSLILGDDGRVFVGSQVRRALGTTIIPWVDVRVVNPDGTPDSSFKLARSPLQFYSMALQKDGKLLLAGADEFSPGLVAGLIRLDQRGTVDTFFDPQVDGIVSEILIQADGKILVSGQLRRVGKASRFYVARLNPDGWMHNMRAFSVRACRSKQFLAYFHCAARRTSNT